MLPSGANAGSKKYSWKPSTSLIKKIEADLKMPKGLSVGSYRRYYSGKIVDKHHIIIAEFVKDDDPGIEIVEAGEWPHISDGGCLVVHLKYDVEAQKIIFLRCNGVA